MRKTKGPGKTHLQVAENFLQTSAAAAAAVVSSESVTAAQERCCQHDLQTGVLSDISRDHRQATVALIALTGNDLHSSCCGSGTYTGN